MVFKVIQMGGNGRGLTSNQTCMFDEFQMERIIFTTMASLYRHLYTCSKQTYPFHADALIALLFHCRQTTISSFIGTQDLYLHMYREVCEHIIITLEFHV